jgi:hypothetical protein
LSIFAQLTNALANDLVSAYCPGEGLTVNTAGELERAPTKHTNNKNTASSSPLVIRTGVSVEALDFSAVDPSCSIKPHESGVRVTFKNTTTGETCVETFDHVVSTVDTHSLADMLTSPFSTTTTSQFATNPTIVTK